MSETEERYIVPGLDRGLRILQLFSPSQPQWALTDIARALGISRSSVFRLVYTLEAGGFLQRNGDKLVRLGPAVLSLGFAWLSSQDIGEVARPHLESLRDATGASAHLGVLDGEHVLYLVRAPSRLALISNVGVGTRLPAATTSMGRVLLSGLDPTALRLLPAGQRPDEATLVEDRARGFVAEPSRFEPGITSVAAPVRDHTGRVIAAINISAPESFLPTARIGDTVPLVLATAAAISAALGLRDKG
jgi:DNA-binding IclR family transcriptional regulator